MPLQKPSGVAILVSLQECGVFLHITVHSAKLGLRSWNAMKVKNDNRSKFSNLTNWKEEA